MTTIPISPPAAAADEARAISTSRLFDAPRDLVFRMFTELEHLSQWWGPRGFTTTTYEMDVRPGGVWRFVMHGPDGTDYDNEITYLEIVRPERLTYTHGPTPVFDTTVTFDDEGGKTRVGMRAVFASAEMRNMVDDEYGAVDGMHETLDRLGEQLARAAEPPFVISRTFDAPRELVFDLWTKEEHLKHWWGPKGLTMLSCTNDLRRGGMMHYGMRAPDGNEMWGKWIYREIVPPKRLTFTVSFSDPQGGTVRAPFSSDWPLEVLSMLTFTEENGKTTVTMEGFPVNASEAERQMFAGFHESMQMGWGGTLDQLTAYLAKVQG
jgi:uncharacterized protein YndB with AHSA1/START domain